MTACFFAIYGGITLSRPLHHRTKQDSAPVPALNSNRQGPLAHQTAEPLACFNVERFYYSNTVSKSDDLVLHIPGRSDIASCRGMVPALLLNEASRFTLAEEFLACKRDNPNNPHRIPDVRFA
jgi:hypothetical protein